jgi:hypothetical protein
MSSAFFLFMAKPQAVRCQNKYHLRKNPTGGGMALVFKGDSIYVRCPDPHCKRWMRLQVILPGINLDFSKAALVHETLPEDFQFGLNQPPLPPKRIPMVIKETA